MDLQQLVDSYEPMSCIMSIRVFPDGHYGNIRIVCGNKPYVDSIEDPNNLAYSGMLDNKFIPDSPYERYIPKDLNFEDACYNCGVLKRPFHTYIHPQRYSFWVDMYMMPLAADKDDTFYFVYSQSLTPEADTDYMSDTDAAISRSVLETCIKLSGTKGFKNTMDDVVDDIMEHCDADKVCLILTDMQRRSFSVLSEAAGSPEADYSVEEYLRSKYDDFFDIIETWEATIAGSTCLIIQNESDMSVLNERNPRWCKTLKEAGVKTIVLYPLRYNNELLGYIWALNFNTDNTQKIRAILESSSYFIASEIFNHRLMDQLRIMGSYDMLTGVKNRNAMNQRVDAIIAGKEELPDKNAVFFVDLNGLKHINDNKGHDNGDVALKKSADILKQVVPDDDIFRAGGDEFMVLATDITDEEIAERLSQLDKYRSNPEDVCFSFGHCQFGKDKDIRVAMSTADRMMYEDKNVFYERFPEFRRD